jgi:pilus assembly protein Flp/PilA
VRDVASFVGPVNPAGDPPAPASAGAFLWFRGHSVAGIGRNFTVRIYRPFKGTCLLSGMTKQVRAFLKDESGATAVEYGLIAASISVMIISVVKGAGSNLKTTFGSVSTGLK